MQGKFKKIAHIIVSALIAVLLFFYATTTNYKNTLSTTQNVATETYTHTINNVPISIDYDNEKYFISGFASTVTVDLIGSNRVVLQKETDEATRTFQVIADLTDLREGTHSVTLQAVNLPTGVNASLNPASFSVKVGKRASRVMAIVGKIPDNQLAEGYIVSKLTVASTSVKVTADEETLAAVAQVEAVVPDVTKLSENYSGTATLQAVDKEGNILPVVFSEEVTTLQATISKIK